jgi:hypothetical protein
LIRVSSGSSGAIRDSSSARASGTSCGFYLGAAPLAFASNAADVPGDIAAWVLDGVTLRQLEARGVTLERHAEVLESDPARWHWLHVRDRVARPDDVLAPLAPLIAALADSQTARRFYTFSNLWSRSSGRGPTTTHGSSRRAWSAAAAAPTRARTTRQRERGRAGAGPALRPAQSISTSRRRASMTSWVSRFATSTTTR